MKKVFKKFIRPIRKLLYQLRGKKPWSYGYMDFRWDSIVTSINNADLLQQFNDKQIPPGFGIALDERVVEYPWIMSKLNTSSKTTLLDAGSTFNFHPLVNHEKVRAKELTIYTYYPEQENFIENRISYQFGDLRSMPFLSSFFDEVVCQSTIEHVDMDNSIYGYDLEKITDTQTKSYEYINVIHELVRVLKPKGKLLLTFPYGKFENYGFFQQFDAEMTSRITEILASQGAVKMDYMLYSLEGWQFKTAEECKNAVSFNPHTGYGRGSDNAAHCRSVCCIEFNKH